MQQLLRRQGQQFITRVYNEEAVQFGGVANHQWSSPKALNRTRALNTMLKRCHMHASQRMHCAWLTCVLDGT